MVDHIAETESHHHACNIDGMDNMASIIASSMTTWPMKVTTIATATSAWKITIVIIIIATTRRIKLRLP